MAKNSVPDWDETASENKDIGGTNIDEGCSPSGMNDAVRKIMAQLKTFFKSSAFRLWDGTDSTKRLAFDLSDITTGTTRTLKAPDVSGTLALASHDVGEKSTIVDDDEISGSDSEASFAQKRWKWSTLTNALTGLFFEIHPGTNGWLRIFSFYLQWGVANVAAPAVVNLPTTFPTGAFFGLASARTTGSGQIAACIDISTTTITLQQLKGSTDTYISGPVNWVTGGY